MEPQALPMIRQMLQLTQAGKIKWHKYDYDAWDGQVEEHKLHAEFIHLARTDEVGSDRTMARLSAFNLMFDYCIGTEGFELICQMLAVGNKDWIDAKDRGKKKLADALNYLENLK